jgi:hypothetical protein
LLDTRCAGRPADKCHDTYPEQCHQGDRDDEFDEREAIARRSGARSLSAQLRHVDAIGEAERPPEHIGTPSTQRGARGRVGGWSLAPSAAVEFREPATPAATDPSLVFTVVNCGGSHRSRSASESAMQTADEAASSE